MVSAAPSQGPYDIPTKGSHPFDSLSANKEPRFLPRHAKDSFDNDRALMRFKTRAGGCYKMISNPF